MKGRLWLVVAALVLAPAAAARADVYDDNPAAVTFGSNVYVFALNRADNQILERHTSGRTWTAWAPVPGLKAGSGASALAYGSKLLLFARGENGEAWQNRLENGRWSGWISLGGGLSSAPAAGLRVGTTTVDLAVRGTDNALYHRFYTPDRGWSPWAGLGGNLGSAPTLLGFNPAGTMDIFVRNADSRIVGRFLNPPNSWSPWYDHGGLTNAAPTSVHARPGRVEIYVRGTDGWLYHQQHALGATGWTLVDRTRLDSAPAATPDPSRPGHALIFARIGDNLHVKRANILDTGLPTYGPWTSLGRIALPPRKSQSPPPPPPPPRDADQDGVPDPADRCASVPRGRFDRDGDGCPGPYARVNFGLRGGWHVLPRGVRIARETVTRVPTGATVRLRCRSCHIRQTLRARSSRVRLATLRGRLLRRGDSFSVTVTAPGRIGQVKTLTVKRYGRTRRERERVASAPFKIVRRCIPVGARRPARSCTATPPTGH